MPYHSTIRSTVDRRPSAYLRHVKSDIEVHLICCTNFLCRFQHSSTVVAIGNNGIVLLSHTYWS